MTLKQFSEFLYFLHVGYKIFSEYMILTVLPILFESL